MMKKKKKVIMKKYKEQIKQNEMGRECGMCGKEDWKI
jgi:hypothetical protein